MLVADPLHRRCAHGMTRNQPRKRLHERRFVRQGRTWLLEYRVCPPEHDCGGRVVDHLLRKPWGTSVHSGDLLENLLHKGGG